MKEMPFNSQHRLLDFHEYQVKVYQEDVVIDQFGAFGNELDEKLSDWVAMHYQPTAFVVAF